MFSLAITAVTDHLPLVLECSLHVVAIAEQHILKPNLYLLGYVSSMELSRDFTLGFLRLLLVVSEDVLIEEVVVVHEPLLASNLLSPFNLLLVNLILNHFPVSSLVSETVKPGVILSPRSRIHESVVGDGHLFEEAQMFFGSHYGRVHLAGLCFVGCLYLILR